VDSHSLPLDVVARLAGEPLRSLTPIGGGRNSQVFRLETAEGRVMALKAYFQHPSDPRDRLGTEFGALRFLWEEGIRCVPQPLAMDAASALGLYGFIPGERHRLPTDSDLDEAVQFLVSLHSLCSRPGAQWLSAASEACFTPRALVENIQTRFERLKAVESDRALSSGLTHFLDSALVPAWQAFLDTCRAHDRFTGEAFDQSLAPSQRTLSPSDFGFHNALWRSEGLAFLDFEYFGWDDPAKMLADFLLHPGMALSLGQRQRFASGLLEHLALEDLPQRTRLLFPLYGIKWCLILLNEFLKGPMERRAFADLEHQSPEERQTLQLQKARLKLQQLLDDHAHFPYFTA